MKAKVFGALLISLCTGVGAVAQVKNHAPSERSAIVTPASIGRLNEVLPGSLCGAEMSYRSITPTEIEISLVKYFYCSDFKVDTAEQVTLQESDLNIVTAKPVLKLVTARDTSRLHNLSCAGYTGGCVRVTVYTGRATIMSPKMGGYDITWGHCCWDEHQVTNIEGMRELQKQGLALTLHVPEIPASASNSSPVFSNPPLLSTCKGQLIAVSSSATDADRDSLAYELSSLHDYKTQSGMPYADEPKITPMVMNKSFAGGRPPFKKIVYRKGFNPARPMGVKQLTIHPRSGEMQIKADSIGEYVVGVSVKEYRTGKLLGSYQRAFKIHVAE